MDDTDISAFRQSLPFSRISQLDAGIYQFSQIGKGLYPEKRTSRLGCVGITDRTDFGWTFRNDLSTLLYPLHTSRYRFAVSRTDLPNRQASAAKMVYQALRYDHTLSRFPAAHPLFR